MTVTARIAVTAVLVALVGAISSPASAGRPERKFTADFRNASGAVIIPCVLTNSMNTLQLRVTKVNKQGPPIRSAEITTTGFSTAPAGTPTSNSGTWSSADSATGISVSGHQLIKAGSWVQVPISSTAPGSITSGATFQFFSWTTTVGGPGGNKYSISGNQPSIAVVTDFENCPADTTPVPPPDPGPGPSDGSSSGQSSAGTPCVSPTLVGGVGDSLLIGTPGNDVILDLLGSNHVEGRGGNDIVCTGPGNDVVLTLNGSDLVWDQGGQNLIRTAAGRDTVQIVRAGSSRIATGKGKDNVTVEGTGRNNIRLGRGRDRAKATSGNDLIKGGAGKDRIAAGDGKNRLGGGRGNDKLRSGRGRDRLNGGKGNDTCRADGGKNKFRNCEVARGNGA